MSVDVRLYRPSRVYLPNVSWKHFSRHFVPALTEILQEIVKGVIVVESPKGGLSHQGLCLDARGEVESDPFPEMSCSCLTCSCRWNRSIFS